VVPATKVASRYVVVTTADNVANQPFPQESSPSGPLGRYLGHAANPAPENSGNLGGVIDMWDSGASVTTGMPKSSLTATATDSGGLVRISVWTCPS
jgi:hypothetical protein